MSFVLTPNPAGLAALEAEAEAACRRRGERAVHEMAADARAAAPVETGHLISTIHADPAGLKVTVGTSYWFYVEYGHRIVAWGHETGKYQAPDPFMRAAVARQAAS